ncbi:MAG: hypothetical protein ABJJ01_00400, partial [Marinomonas sp.]
WEDKIAYQAGALMDVGFSDAVPKFADIKDGLPDPASFAPEARGLVLWGYAFGTRAGDQMEFSITGPQGWRHDQIVEFTKPQAQVFRATGRKRPTDGWPRGTYEGVVTFMRGDQILSAETLTISR